MSRRDRPGTTTAVAKGRPRDDVAAPELEAILCWCWRQPEGVTPEASARIAAVARDMPKRAGNECLGAPGKRGVTSSAVPTRMNKFLCARACSGLAD